MKRSLESEDGGKRHWSLTVWKITQRTIIRSASSMFHRRTDLAAMALPVLRGGDGTAAIILQRC